MKDKVRTVTFLTREQVDYLDKLGKDAMFTRGAKLSRVEILSELVDFLMQSGVDVQKLDLNHGHLAEGILKQVQQYTRESQDA